MYLGILLGLIIPAGIVTLAIGLFWALNVWNDYSSNRGDAE